MEAAFSISVATAGGVLRVGVCGEFNLAVGPAVHEHVAAGLDDPDVTAVVIDLCRTTFIDSSGLGTLISVKRSAETSGKALHVDGVHGPIARVFDVTGLRSLLVADGGSEDESSSVGLPR